MTSCSLRPACADDAAQLSDLALRSKAMWSSYTPEFIAACRAELTYTEADIAAVDQHYVLACFDDAVLGFYGLRNIDARTIELEALFIEPEATRQGIGQQLMQAAVAHAKKMGARELTITSDPHAEPFYARMGAVKFDERESGSVPGRFLPLMRVALWPWRVRAATLSDAAALADMAGRLFVDAFGKANKQSNMDVYIAANFGAAIQRGQIFDADADTLLIERDGQMVGYAQVNYGPTPVAFKLLRPAGIARFYLDASEHGSGAANALFEALQKAALQRGAQQLWLCVWEHNARAIAYYKKAGFEARGEVAFRLGQELQRDIVMVRECAG